MRTERVCSELEMKETVTRGFLQIIVFTVALLEMTFAARRGSYV